MTGLGALAGGSSSANAINALGHIVGWSQQPDSQPRAVIWRDGTMSAIAVGVAEDVNKADWVVGSGSVPLPRALARDDRPSAARGLDPGRHELFLSDRNWTTDPAVDTVAVGTRVTWTWVTGRQYTACSPSGRPASPAARYVDGVGKTLQRQFQRAGHLPVQLLRLIPGNMFGRVVVQ